MGKSRKIDNVIEITAKQKTRTTGKPKPVPKRTVGQFLRCKYFCGIDVAEGHLDYVIIDDKMTEYADGRVDESPDGLAIIMADLDRLGTRAAPVVVSIEATTSLAKRALIDAGYKVVVLNAKSVVNTRNDLDLDGAKTDYIDALAIAKTVKDNRQRWAPAVQDDPIIASMRVAGRSDVDEGRRAIKLSQVMRANFRSSWPTFLDVFGPLRLREPKVLALIDAVPTLSAARALSLEDWDAQLHAIQKVTGYQWGNYAKQAKALYDMAQAPAFALPPVTEAAFARRLGLLTDGLRNAVKVWDDAIDWSQECWDSYPKKHLFEGAVGLTPRIATRVLGEIGLENHYFPHPDSLCKYAGYAPVPRQSGNRSGTKIPKAYNRNLHQAGLQWVGQTLNPNTTSDGAWAHYHHQAQVMGKTGPQASRHTGARLMHGVWHCLTTDTAWDEEQLWMHQEDHLRALASLYVPKAQRKSADGKTKRRIEIIEEAQIKLANLEASKAATEAASGIVAS